MNKLLLTALLGLLVLGAAPALATGPVDLEAGLDLFGKYVWRGQVGSPDPVLQPSVGVGLAGFKAGFWGNIDTSDVNETIDNETQWKFNEYRWSLGWGMSLPKVSLGAGLLHYRYPVWDASTTELYLHAELGVLLAPHVTFYQDIDEIKGGYWEAGVSHDVALSPSTDLEFDATLGLGSQGYIAGYFGYATLIPNVPELPGSATMTDFALTAAVPIDLALFFTLTPSVTYSTLLGDVKDVVEAGGAGSSGEADAFFWGLSASFKF